MSQQPPIVLAFAGNDPSGGAGLTADTQALASVGCHTAPVVTCLTVQDTHNIHQIMPIPPEHIRSQAEAILADLPIAAFKVGLAPAVETVEAIYHILAQRPDLPVLVDPILAAGGGLAVADEELQAALIDFLLPVTTLLTPNSQEARALTENATSLPDAAEQLFMQGCDYVCITGEHETTPQVVNTLFGRAQGGKALASWGWQRLEGRYHGSGCTFAAAAAGLLAHGKSVMEAVYEAQLYTWRSLQHSSRYSQSDGQALPNRLFQYL